MTLKKIKTDNNPVFAVIIKKIDILFKNKKISKKFPDN